MDHGLEKKSELVGELRHVEEDEAQIGFGFLRTILENDDSGWQQTNC